MSLLQMPDDQIKKVIANLEKASKQTELLDNWFRIRNKIIRLKRILNERSKHSSN